MSSHVQSCPLRFVFLLLSCSELLWTALVVFEGGHWPGDLYEHLQACPCKNRRKGPYQGDTADGNQNIDVFDTFWYRIWVPLTHRVTQRQVFLQPLRITSIQWKMRRPETPVMLCQVLSAYWASCMNHYDMSWSSPSGTCSWSREPCSLWGGIAKSAPMAAHHTTSRFKKRVLVHACHLFVRARWIYNSCRLTLTTY